MSGGHLFLVSFGGLLALTGLAVSLPVAWRRLRGGTGSSSPLFSLIQRYASYGVLAFAAGAVLVVLPFLLPVPVGGWSRGDDRGSPNWSPTVVEIIIDPSRPVAGQTVRVQVNASDPDRDRLDVRWRADGGQFIGGDSGVSVTYQPPTSGTGFRLTATVSDGKNPPVSVSRSFALAGAAPTPTRATQGLSTPTRPTPTLSTLTPVLPTPSPDPATVDINGRWTHSGGFVDLSETAPGQFTYRGFNTSGQLVAEGTAARKGAVLTVSGKVPAFGITFGGDLQIISGSLIQGTLKDALGGSTPISLSR